MLIPPESGDINQQGLQSQIFHVLQKYSRIPAIVLTLAGGKLSSGKWEEQ